MGDDRDRIAATKNAQKMARILDAAKASQVNEVGLNEDQIIELYRLWLIVGSWTKSPDFAKLYGDKFLLPHAPKPNPGGTKDLDLLRVAVKGFVYTNDKDNDASHRSGAFDLVHNRMINFMLVFQTALAKQSRSKADALKKKLLEARDYVSLNYNKHWQ